MTRVLVTGATGFVGRALIPVLIAEGYDVTITSRNAHPDAFPDGVRMVTVGDLGPATDWRDALQDVDAVVHLAARVHVMTETNANPRGAFQQANTEGTRRLAEQALDAGVSRFVYLSSIKVNGEDTQPGAAFTEQMRPAPQDPYGESKADAEDLLLELGKTTTLEPVILRPPLVYGPGVKGNFLTLLSAAAKGVPLPIGCATNIRSMIYVGNLVDAIQLCVKDAEAPGHIFLVRDREDVTVRQTYLAIGEALGRKIRPLPLPRILLRLAGWLTGRQSTVRRLLDSLRLDDRHIRQTLAWQPPHSMTAGLQATADWYKKEAANQ